MVWRDIQNFITAINNNLHLIYIQEKVLVLIKQTKNLNDRKISVYRIDLFSAWPIGKERII